MEIDIVTKFDWVLRHFEEISPLDKNQLMLVIEQIYDKYNKDDVNQVKMELERISEHVIKIPNGYIID